MKWTKSDTLALASLNCQCAGLGLVRGPRGENSPCLCVFRKVFRICWNRYRFGRLEQMERGAPIVNIAGLGRRARRQPGAFSFTLECYLADFTLVAKRVLSADEFRFFSAAYLSGVDPKLAHGAVNMTRAQFMYVCKGMEPRLGRAFLECEPFSLLPDQYFTRPAPGTLTPALPGFKPARYRPLVPPLAAPAKLRKAA
jgi:hypothetical protein